MMRFWLCILLVFGALPSGAQRFFEDNLDSLVALYGTYRADDTAKLNLCARIARSHNNADTTLMWANELIRLARVQHDGVSEANAYFYMGWAYCTLGDYDKCIESCRRNLRIVDSLGLPYIPSQAGALYYLGDSYYFLQMYDESDDYLLASVNCARANKDYYFFFLSMDHLANNFVERGMFQEADNVFKELIANDSLIDSNDNYIVLYSDYSVMFLDWYRDINNSQPDSLIKKSEHLARIARSFESDFYSVLFYADLFLAEAYAFDCLNCVNTPDRRAELRDSIRQLINEATDYLEIIDGDRNIIDLDILRGRYYLVDHKPQVTRNIIDSIDVTICDGNGYSPYELQLFYYLKYEYFKSVNDIDSALYYRVAFYDSKLHSLSVDAAVQSSKKLELANYNEQMRIRSIEEQRHRNMLIYISIVVFFIIIIGVHEFIRKYRHNKELNEKNAILLCQTEEINSQKDELAERNEQITEKNRHITDSINSASLIQKAALPRHEDLQELFGDYFLINRPLNIVSGDFYWASKVGRYHLLVCADCTGHGVPGAFLSILGVSLLNDVTAGISDSTKASDILNSLRAKLMKSLGQSKQKYEEGIIFSMDGMDMALLMIDYESLTAQYAGAYRPLWIWRDGEIIQIKADKMPIGLYLGPETDFTNHELRLMKGDMLYMFSDGIPDQFGYTDDGHTDSKHFSLRRLSGLLSEVGGKPSSEQREIIERAVDTWKNGYMQLDDNILIGIRI